MNVQSTPSDSHFRTGQPVRRPEDPQLVRGQGRYTDDVNLPGQAYALVVRSRHAHGVIRRLDVAAARAMPGVLAVYTGADMADYAPFKVRVALNNRDGKPLDPPLRQTLATDKVRFVGDPVACVVAETALQARDAAEAVELDIDPLPVVTSATEAAKPGAPVIYDGAPDNVLLDYHFGDSAKVADAFAAAAHVTRLELLNTRLVVNAMEPRAAVASYDAAAERYGITLGSQGVIGLRGQIADVLKIPPNKLRVVTHNTGGSFGMKASVYPEYICLLHAARALGRPVKWTDDRSGAFLSDHHGRDHEVTGELALDADGRFLALRITSYGNMGGYVGAMAPLMPTLNTVKNVIGVYRTPLLEVIGKCVFTNTVLVSAYRGAGRPEGNYFMERLIDAAASEMGIDRIELRRRNQIKPKELPFKAASGLVYDSGDFPALLKEALEAADWKGFAKRKREAKKRGRLRGFGVGSYLEATAGGGKEFGRIRFDKDGGVTFLTGTLDYGQGHAAPLAQIISEQLGVPFDRIRLVQGDSDLLPLGGGTGGSRTMMNSGAAAAAAAQKVIENGKQIAAHVLEASAVDIEFGAGRFVIAGTDRSIGIMELAKEINEGLALPDDAPHALDAEHVVEDVPSAFPNGCHVAEIEIDPDTGVTEVVSYLSVNDFGTVLNPLILEGQVHGGIVQALGQALLEHAVYDEDGQLVTGSFMDYAMPRASHVPDLVSHSHPVPAKTNPLGVKGCGEAGCAGGLVAITNAVMDALSEFGIRHLDMPLTPARVWGAIKDAKVKAA